MEQLKERIQTDGQAIGSAIIKVDSFLNHQIDVELLSELGKEFAERFSDCKANKVLTIEASGIAVACAAAWHLGGLPVVFAKKSAPNTMTDGFYSTEIASFTKGTVSKAVVSQRFLSREDRVLIIDDFLAYGEAALGLVDLVNQAGATLMGIGSIIEKEYQGGGGKLRNRGYRVESLAVIRSIENGKILFAD